MRNTLGRRGDCGVPTPADRIRLFVSKVEYLESLSYVETLLTKGSGVTLTIGPSPTSGVQFRGPQREQVDAFVNTLRMFMQNNDSVSIANVAAAVDQLPLPQEDTQAFRDVRRILNEFLDSKCAGWFGQRPETNRDVLETVLYGELSHTNEAARDRYFSWVEAIGPRLVHLQFVDVTQTYLAALQAMARVCRRLLAAIEPS
jgi:hypothetical protein